VGISRWTAFAAGVLFALSPYALKRNIQHLALATYLVPIPCMIGLVIASRYQQRSWRMLVILGIGCALLGFDYVYYAFFGCFVLAAASLIALANRRPRDARLGVVFMAIIVAATVINLAPTLAIWGRVGKPMMIPDKSAAESERYGLKIRHLLSPVSAHSFPLFQSWNASESHAGFPLETENQDNRLGVVGALGFVALLWRTVIRRRGGRSLFDAAGQLTLGLLLLGTIGGFGSLFNLLVSPDIRAYDRVFPFIHFFALMAFGLLLDEWLQKVRTPFHRPLAAALVVIVVVVGISDQGHAAEEVNEVYESSRQELAALRVVVGNMESQLGPDAMVFQLPVAGFPNDAAFGKDSNEAAKPFLVSEALRWSFPAFPEGLARWQRRVANLPANELVETLRAAGFSAILVDRSELDDSGQSIVGSLSAHPDVIKITESRRYVAFDVRRVSAIEGAGSVPLTADLLPSSIGLPRCSEPAVASVDRIDTSQPPFPSTVDTTSGEFMITGWAVDPRARSEAFEVDVTIGERLFPTLYGMERPDVAIARQTPAYRSSGFATRIRKGTVPAGAYPLGLRIVDRGHTCFYEWQSLTIQIR
jgi:phosphoglycerol transferase